MLTANFLFSRVAPNRAITHKVRIVEFAICEAEMRKLKYSYMRIYFGKIMR
jgi:hypothetical protein